MTIPPKAVLLLGLTGNLGGLLLGLCTNDPFWPLAGLIAQGCLLLDQGPERENESLK